MSAPGRQMMERLAAVLCALVCLAAAADPAERLADPVQEARARHILQETRCLVCQGQSIDDSDADLAHDLRHIIRAQVAAGRSNAEIRGFLVSRYGEFVLLRPPFSLSNALLWGAPFAVGLLGLGLLIFRGKSRAPAPALSAQEEARIDAIRSDQEH